MIRGNRVHKILVFFLLLTVSPTVFMGCSQSGIPFNQVVWMQSRFQRHLMVNDIKRNHLRLTMSEADVQQLLGAPDMRLAPHGITGADKDAAFYLYYELDPSNTPGAFDSAYFIVVISENGKVMNSFLFVN